MTHIFAKGPVDGRTNTHIPEKPRHQLKLDTFC